MQGALSDGEGCGDPLQGKQHNPETHIRGIHFALYVHPSSFAVLQNGFTHVYMKAQLNYV